MTYVRHLPEKYCQARKYYPRFMGILERLQARSKPEYGEGVHTDGIKLMEEALLGECGEHGRRQKIFQGGSSTFLEIQGVKTQIFWACDWQNKKNYQIRGGGHLTPLPPPVGAYSGERMFGRQTQIFSRHHHSPLHHNFLSDPKILNTFCGPIGPFWVHG